MSQSLTVELSDELYDAVRRQAEADGAQPADVVADSLRQFLGHETGEGNARSRLSDADLAREYANLFQEIANSHCVAAKQAAYTAKGGLEDLFGSVDLGYATGIDNEEIDTDLGREYADPNEAD